MCRYCRKSKANLRAIWIVALILIGVFAPFYVYFDLDNWRNRPAMPRAPEVEIVGIQYFCPGTPGTTPRIVIEQNGTILGPGSCWSGPSRLKP